jgi:hypothetical protein
MLPPTACSRVGVNMRVDEANNALNPAFAK